MNDESFMQMQRDVVGFITEVQNYLNVLYKNHDSQKHMLKLPMDLKIFCMPTDYSKMTENEVIGQRIISSKLSECNQYLDKLRSRILNKTSRILVTGDVNSGKSTFINALLGLDLLPTDQQPCTQSFCEIVTGDSRDEAVHALMDYSAYDLANEHSYVPMSICQMQNEIQEEDVPYQMFKVFLPRHKSIFLSEAAHPVELSLIDSPGLNSDLFKTMSLFSQQEEIDVVLFLVNAANHITLSAREFLSTASNEKAYIFIVVNKFDEINNREKCKRLVLNQIKEVLPLTFIDRDEMIHFISARKIMESFLHETSLTPKMNSIHTMDSFKEIGGGTSPAEGITREDSWQTEFTKLERDLYRFVMEKRTRSKLLPAKTFLSKCLSEVLLVLEATQGVNGEEIEKVRQELSIIGPVYEQLQTHNGFLQADLLKVTETYCSKAYEDAVSCFGDNLVVAKCVQESPWRGIWSIWSFLEQTHLNVSKSVEDCFLVLNRRSDLLVNEGLGKLQKTAHGHLPYIFAQSLPAVSKMASCPSSLAKPSLFSLWNLLDTSLLTRIPLSTVLATAFAGLAFFVNTNFYFVKPPWAQAMALGSLTLSILKTIYQTESLVKDRLIYLYGQCYSPAWIHGVASGAQARARKSLQPRQLQLVQCYETALQEQKRLQAGKELRKAQLSTSISYFQSNQAKVKELLSIINTYRI